MLHTESAITLSILTAWRLGVTSNSRSLDFFPLLSEAHLPQTKQSPCRVSILRRMKARIVLSESFVVSPSLGFVEPTKKQQGPKTKLLFAGRECEDAAAAPRAGDNKRGGGAGAQGQVLAAFAAVKCGGGGSLRRPSIQRRHAASAPHFCARGHGLRRRPRQRPL